MVLGKVPDNPLIRDNYQGGVCYAVSRKVPDDSLICNNRQGGACCTVLGKVLNNRWVPNDPLVLGDPLIGDDH